MVYHEGLNKCMLLNVVWKTPINITIWNGPIGVYYGYGDAVLFVGGGRSLEVDT